MGETGLDFYYNHIKKENQIKSFEMHIEIAQEQPTDSYSYEGC